MNRAQLQLPQQITLTEESECAMIDGVREVPLRSLAPGKRFELVLQATTPYPHKRIPGTVIRHGPGTSAVVLDHADKERQFTTQEGQTVVLQVAGGIVYWSPGTAVMPLAGTRDITRWTTKGGTGVGLTPEAASQDETQERGKHMAKTASATKGEGARYASLPGLGVGGASGHARPAKKKTGKGPKLVRTAKTPKEMNACRCGCGERVTGQFRQGHDSKYYSILRQVKASTMAFNQMPRAMQSECKDRAGAMRILASSKH